MRNSKEIESDCYKREAKENQLSLGLEQGGSMHGRKIVIKTSCTLERYNQI